MRNVSSISQLLSQSSMFICESECSLGVTFNLREWDWGSQAANHKSEWSIDFISRYQTMSLCNAQEYTNMVGRFV